MPPAAIRGSCTGCTDQGNQAHRSGFFPPVVASGFKSFCNNRIHANLCTFEGKLQVGNHMHHGDAAFLQPGSPGSRVTCAGEHDAHAFFCDDVHVLFNIRIEQRHIHTKRLVGGQFAFADLFAQHLGIHTSCANQTQTTGIADCRSQFPAAAPDHTALYDGKFNS